MSERSLSKQIKAVEREARSRDDELRGEITEVGRSVSRTQDAVVQNLDAIRALREQSEDVRGDVAQLIERVAEGFDELGRSMRAMEEKSREATLQIVDGIRTAEESSRRGLQQISTGVAIGDALKAAAEAEEIEDGMAEAAAELEAARTGAELAIEERRLEYERAANDVYEALDAKLTDLGADVVTLQNLLIGASEDLGVDEAVCQRIVADGARVSRAVLAERDRAIASALEDVDETALMRIADARDALAAFVERVSTPRPDLGDGGVDGLGIPFVVVQATETEYNGEEGRGAVFGPDCVVFQCGERHEQRPIPPDLGARIQQLCAGLGVSAGSALDGDSVDLLKREIDTLVDGGVLAPADAGLIAAHLDAYPLQWLESQAAER